MNIQLPDFVIVPPEERPDPMIAAVAWNKENLISAEAILDRDAHSEPARFNSISLPSWLAVAQRAGVNHIAAEEIARIPFSLYADTLNQRNDGSEMTVIEDQIVAALGKDHVLRFEQVAPSEVKDQRSRGQRLGNGAFYSDHFGKNIINIWDERFLVTLKDLGCEDIIAFRRPKHETVDIEGEFRGDFGQWPAEFRVYVFDGKITGISNYYPQVEMNPGHWYHEVKQCLQLAQNMIDTMDELKLGVGNHRLSPNVDPKAQPLDWIPSTWSHRDFTLDFLLDGKTNKMVFLEGGPAGLIAAHPCCFQPHDGDPADILKGFAHTAGEDPIALEDLAPSIAFEFLTAHE